MLYPVHIRILKTGRRFEKARERAMKTIHDLGEIPHTIKNKEIGMLVN